MIVVLWKSLSCEISEVKLSSATMTIFMYAKAKTSAFVCLKNFKERDTFTELYSSTVRIVCILLILHFHAIKKFIS